MNEISIHSGDPAMTAHARPKREPGSRLSVGFVLTHNFTLLAFSGFVDALRLAADEGDRSRQISCSWSIVSHDMRPIRASCGVEITPTTGLENSGQFDYIVVVGGVLDGRDVHADLKAYLKRADSLSVPLVSVCTGCFVLARLNLFQGRKCCVSWFHVSEFEHRFPEVDATCEELFVIDRDRISCAGGTSVIHLAAHLVEQHCGAAVARKALRIMIEGEQRSPIAPQPQPLWGATSKDFRVRKAMLLMERTLGNPLSCEFIAKHVGLSQRQLERLFRLEMGQTPSDFLMSLRLRNAHDLLQTCREPITDIALQCGFVSRSHFAASFRMKYGHSPSSARSRAKAQGTSAQHESRFSAAGEGGTL